MDLLCLYALGPLSGLENTGGWRDSGPDYKARRSRRTRIGRRKNRLLRENSVRKSGDLASSRRRRRRAERLSAVAAVYVGQLGGCGSRHRFRWAVGDWRATD